jgi:hypothetical protein
LGDSNSKSFISSLLCSLSNIEIVECLVVVELSTSKRCFSLIVLSSKRADLRIGLLKSFLGNSKGNIGKVESSLSIIISLSSKANSVLGIDNISISLFKLIISII